MNTDTVESTEPVVRPLYGHSSMETAYVVESYPYGSLRTQIRFWLEFSAKKGWRFMAQTLNPKTGAWNKPKASTYVSFGANMYLDAKGHVQWSGVHEYSHARDFELFVKRFPQADVSRLAPWVQKKVEYYKLVVKMNEQGKSGWLVNGVPAPLSDLDKERNIAELKGWELVRTLLLFNATLNASET